MPAKLLQWRSRFPCDGAYGTDGCWGVHPFWLQPSALDRKKLQGCMQTPRLSKYSNICPHGTCLRIMKFIMFCSTYHLKRPF